LEPGMDDLPPIAFLQSLPSSPPAQLPSSSSRRHEVKPAQVPPVPAAQKPAPKPKKPREERVKGKPTISPHKVQIIVQERNQFSITSKEAALVLTAAVEEFLRLIVVAGQKQAMRARHQLIALRDIANIVHDQGRFNFLEETIPRTVDIDAAISLRDAIQNGNAIGRECARNSSPPPLGIASSNANNMSNGAHSRRDHEYIENGDENAGYDSWSDT